MSRMSHLGVLISTLVLVGAACGGTAATTTTVGATTGTAGAAAATPTVAVTTTKAATTTTDTATPTTGPPRTTTTTPSGEISRLDWELALAAAAAQSGYFDGFTDSDVVAVAYWMCQDLADAISPWVRAVSIAATEDQLLISQWKVLLGALQIPPGCETEDQQAAADEAFEALNDF